MFMHVVNDDSFVWQCVAYTLQNADVKKAPKKIKGIDPATCTEITTEHRQCHNDETCQSDSCVLICNTLEGGACVHKKEHESDNTEPKNASKNLELQ